MTSDSTNLYELPPDLPRPLDDGAAAHLAGTRVPPIELRCTSGSMIALSREAGVAVVFAFPRTGQPGVPPLVPEWDQIPGARGCTPQACRFRDLAAEFAQHSCRIFGLSTQDHEYQREMSTRLRLPYPVLSDAKLRLSRALRLPTFTIGSETLLKRLAWVQRDGVIEKVFYPVFPPDRNADDVLQWLELAD